MALDVKTMPRNFGVKSIRAASFACLAVAATPAWAGPPFLTDDPEPTEPGHFEVFLYAEGASVHGDIAGEAGFDFNYGAAPDLQLTAVIPLRVERPDGGSFASGFGNIELGAKLRIAHQATFGLDVAIFPTVSLPAASHMGDDHASLFLPVWGERSGESWSAFGGGGCALNRGGGSRDYCVAGAAITRQLHDLEFGVELFHETADADDAADATVLGLGVTYDVSEQLHLLSYAGAQLENVDENGRGLGYAAVLFTF